jgi:hypothetical protein
MTLRLLLATVVILTPTTAASDRVSDFVSGCLQKSRFPDAQRAFLQSIPVPNAKHPVRGSAEQFFHAINQPFDGERFDEILYLMLLKEMSDMWIGGEAGNKDEMIR